MTRTEVESNYFEWLYKLVCGHKHSKNISYRKLLEYFHEVEFRYILPKDENREIDGENLRYTFAKKYYNPNNIDLVIDMLSRPCSVLEMMIALAIRCEDIMDDPSIGDRTNQWFWKMVVNLGLGGMYDSNFNKQLVEDSVNTFLKREYKPNGDGSLFKIRNTTRDLRKFEIWIQMLWYLDTLV